MISMNDWRKKLIDYDYYYSMSDDHKVWAKGEADRDEINNIYKASSLYHKEVYSAAMKYHSGDMTAEEFDKEFKRISTLHAMDDLLHSINGGL
mgnify:CR=1 FL=1